MTKFSEILFNGLMVGLGSKAPGAEGVPAQSRGAGLRIWRASEQAVTVAQIWFESLLFAQIWSWGWHHHWKMFLHDVSCLRINIFKALQIRNSSAGDMWSSSNNAVSLDGVSLVFR